MGITVTDADFMDRAIVLAKQAQAQGEVPVGAVVTYNNRIIAEGYNQPITLQDPSAHAEMIALRNAAKALKNYRLLNTTLYVTLEPCAMCAALLIHARIKRLVFGAKDPKTGAICSQLSLLDGPHCNHVIHHEQGLRAHDCSALLVDFFKGKR